ncbi:MAG TPA: hypothetical protein PKA50_15115 [Gemmatimonadales bacterium]|nr:hypothetical protein [Gemmatimonadales bacterium]
MPMIRERLGLILGLALTLPVGAAAQLPLVASGMAGVSFDIDDRDPVSGGGFSFLTEAGLAYARIEFGAEVGQHNLGNDRKAKQYGAFVRFTAPASRRAVPYLVAGLAQYRYSPAGSGSTHALGGSLGPGVRLGLDEGHLALLLEARFHTSFERARVISSQDFIAVAAGLRLAL